VTEIVCLRHAESANVLAGASGAMPDSALTAAGRLQAEAAARLVGPVRRVYASSAVRAVDTAAPIAAAAGVDVVAVPALAEFGVGSRDGEIDAALRRETADVLHAWVVEGNLDRRVADGETGHDVLARMRAALSGIAAAHPADRVAVVGHGGSLTFCLSVLCRLGASLWGAYLPHASPVHVHHDGANWRCEDWPGAAGMGG
jgi:broad specificity phosphatase PhoE